MYDRDVDTSIYLDCNATTPTCPEAIDAVTRAMLHCGNASSAHLPGRAAADIVREGRVRVAALLGVADPDEIVFTSGATEANNMVIAGVAEAARRPGSPPPEILVSAIEHSSILAPARKLDRLGVIRLVVIPVDATGIVKVSDVAERITPRTALVSVQGANNEIGTLQPVHAIGDLCKARGVLFHTDLCQSFGKIHFDPSKYDLASMSAHKLYGPTGVGALYGRKAVLEWLEPQTLGGGQEHGRRAGTLNTQGIAGFGAAAEAMGRSWGDGSELRRLRRLRDLLLALLRQWLDVHVNGAIDPPCWEAGHACERRLPHNLNVTLRGVDGPAFHEAVRGRVALSAGSACKALGGQRSHVLDAIGAPTDGAIVRMAVGSMNDETSVREAAEAIVRAALGSPATARTAPAAPCEASGSGAPAPSGSVVASVELATVRNELERAFVGRYGVEAVGAGEGARGPTLRVFVRGDAGDAVRAVPPTWRGYPVEVTPTPAAQAVAPSGEADSTPHAVRVLDAPAGSTVEAGGWAAPQLPGEVPPTYALPAGLSGPSEVRVVAPTGEVRRWRGSLPVAGLITLRYGDMERLSVPSTRAAVIRGSRAAAPVALRRPVLLDMTGSPDAVVMVKGARCKEVP